MGSSEMGSCGIFAATRPSSSIARWILWCVSAHCGWSSSTVAPQRRRLARRAIAATSSRSRANFTMAGEGESTACARCVFRNSCGSSRSRSRTAAVAVRQAAYNCPASRLLSRQRANPSAMRRQSSGFERATGTRNFIATCAAMAPSRTCCCTLSGSSSTRPIRRDTQLVLRSKRRANSSSP